MKTRAQRWGIEPSSVMEEEGDGSTPYEAEIELSKAISLRRIADAFELNDAAPSLYEALKPFADMPFDCDMPSDLTDDEAAEWFASYTLPASLIRQARAALAKARGEQ